MNINVYGVGRSGTKAVQLYIAHQIAQKEGKIWMNYEPYFHCSRKMERSYRGLLLNLRHPHLLGKDEKFSPNHTRFIRGLKHRKLSTVTKFIRGNGRVEQIEDIMQPDHSFVIVRNLYDTLASLFAANWDYYRYGYSYYPLTSIIFLKNIIRQAEKLNLIPTKYQTYIKHPNELDRITANAFCWYIMNKYILSIERSNFYFIDYTDISSLPKRLHHILPQYFDGKEPISQSKYKGDYIHSDILLKSADNTIRRYANILNEIPFYLFSRATHFSPILVNRKSGEEVNAVLNPNFPADSKEWSPQKLIIKPSSILDEMNEEIKTMLQAKLHKADHTNVKV